MPKAFSHHHKTSTSDTCWILIRELILHTDFNTPWSPSQSRWSKLYLTHIYVTCYSNPTMLMFTCSPQAIYCTEYLALLFRKIFPNVWPNSSYLKCAEFSSPWWQWMHSSALQPADGSCLPLRPLSPLPLLANPIFSPLSGSFSSLSSVLFAISSPLSRAIASKPYFQLKINCAYWCWTACKDSFMFENQTSLHTSS